MSIDKQEAVDEKNR